MCNMLRKRPILLCYNSIQKHTDKLPEEYSSFQYNMELFKRAKHKLEHLIKRCYKNYTLMLYSVKFPWTLLKWSPGLARHKWARIQTQIFRGNTFFSTVTVDLFLGYFLDVGRSYFHSLKFVWKITIVSIFLFF